MKKLENFLDLKFLVINRCFIIILGLYYLLSTPICNATNDLDQQTTDTNLEETVNAPMTPPRNDNSLECPPSTPDGVQNQIVTPKMMQDDFPKNYLNLMNFKQGDLIYGLEGSRQRIRELIRTHYKLEIITADHYNNFFIGLNGNILNPEFNLELLFHESGSSFSDEERDLIKNYAEFLKGYGLEEKILNSDKNSEFALFKRKSCKLTIIFAKLKGYRIHFILDSLKMRRVVPKCQEFKDDYTGAELRFLYRQYLKNESNISHVTFYRKGERVPPPWEWDGTPEFWRENYVPNFIEKLKRAKPIPFSSLLDMETEESASHGVGIKRKNSDVIVSPNKKGATNEEY